MKSVVWFVLTWVFLATTFTMIFNHECLKDRLVAQDSHIQTLLLTNDNTNKVLLKTRDTLTAVKLKCDSNWATVKCIEYYVKFNSAANCDSVYRIILESGNGDGGLAGKCSSPNE